MNAPQRIDTPRLILERPRLSDASDMFDRYSNDEEVTRLLTWPRHKELADAEAFIAFSDSEWERWPVGPYMIRAKESGLLLGSTGLVFEAQKRASTGYVLAKDAWGHGYATESLVAMKALATEVGVGRLFALCYPDHRASRNVLEKEDFALEGTLRSFAEFPNLNPGGLEDVVCYSWLPCSLKQGEKE